jgi:hypothetical protein
MKIIRFCLLLFCLTYLVSCGQVNHQNYLMEDYSASNNLTQGKLTETATPRIIQQLNQQLEQYTPQVEIVSPQKEQIFNQTKINVQLKVKDLPIFQDDQLKLGNHLDLVLDNEASQQIYDLTNPVILENLTPGTHTIRVFATRPWGESFKNDGAYAQTTFSILTETNDNRPERNLPLLTYNSPTGTYGAEPFLLDFYLTNAPLHSIAQKDPNLQDWKVKITINGDSFFLENWQPVYLTGLNKGENWIKLELIDEEGNNIENAFNNTVRVINYDPQQLNTLSKLVTDRIPLTDAKSIVEQNYYIQPVGTPEIIEPSVEIKPEPNVETTTKNIAPSEEPKVEDNSQAAIKLVPSPAIAKSEDNNSQVTPENNTKEVIVEIAKQPLIITVPEITKIEEENAKKADIEKKEVKNEPTPPIESPESQQIITITEDNSDSSTPIAEIEIPQPESVEITEKDTKINIPSQETTASSGWWKKLLISLRQKLEGLVKMLPSEV